MHRFFLPVFIVLFLLFNHGATAQVGELDNTFSGDGIFLFKVPEVMTNTGTGIELDAEGNYVITGKSASQDPSFSNFLILRLKTDGTLDSSFSDDGYVATNTFDRSFAHDLGLQFDGKILVTGQDFNSIDTTENIGIMRLNSDGTLDESFGDSGRVDIDHGHTEEGHTIIQLPDGKVVLTGHTDYDLLAGEIDGTSRNNIFLARLNADGSNDATFGTDGFQTYDFGTTQDYAKNMILQNDQYIAGSCTCINSKCKATMMRINPDGAIDQTFGNNGLTQIPDGVESVFWRMARQPDGKIVAAGQVMYVQPAYDFIVMRFYADGKVDSTFGVNGVFSLDLGEPAEKLEDIAIQADGKIVCAGYTSESTANQSEGNAAVIRLNTDGTLDETFSEDGIFVVSTVPGFDETKALLIDGDGGIVVTGFAHMLGTGGGEVFAFRLTGDCAGKYQITSSAPATYCKGAAPTFRVSPAATSYQWKRDGNNINGATASTYIPKGSGSYLCEVTGDCGVFTTNAIQVQVNPKPKAVIKPAGTVTICEGDSVLLKANNSAGLGYQWINGSTEIAGATTSAYWAKEQGAYRVQTTNTFACVSKSSPTNVQVTCRGVNEPEEQQMNIYPNPAAGALFIQFNSLSGEAIRFRLFDFAGRVVKDESGLGGEPAHLLNLSDVLPGVYFLEVKTSAKVFRQVVTVER
jgi:uncharacterized delta-60 repeat protein